VARREGLEPPTARSVARRSSSVGWPGVRPCCSRMLLTSAESGASHPPGVV